MYYSNKLTILEDLFNTKDILLKPDYIKVRDCEYPIIDDVIILSPENKQTNFIKKHLFEKRSSKYQESEQYFAEDIQFTFGEEWKEYPTISIDHEKEYRNYFDIVDMDLESFRICDLGCGIGRWSNYLKDRCKEIVLVDFSDAIFIARENLKSSDNCLFFMCDLTNLPFKNKFADLIICIGVLHHLPSPCLSAVRSLEQFAPLMLIYLYYSLDNRPFYFRLILGLITFIRLILCKIQSRIFRKIFCKVATITIYLPLSYLSMMLKPFNLNRLVPLEGFYDGKSVSRIEQDVYDRFFTRIEQRVSRKDIMELKDTFSSVVVSNGKPYWHFLCKK